MRTRFVVGDKRIDVVADDATPLSELPNRLKYELGRSDVASNFWAFIGQFLVAFKQYHLTIWYKDLGEYFTQVSGLRFSPASHVELRIPAVMDLQSGFITLVVFPNGNSDVIWETVEAARQRVEAHTSQINVPNN